MPRFAVIGAGVAGLAAARNLCALGHSVTVFEQVADPTPVGAGILLQPSGQAVLSAMGLLGSVAAFGARVNSLQGYSGRWRTLDLHYRDLNPEFFGIGIHRAQLHRVLWRAAEAAGAEICLGAGVAAVSQNEHSAEVHFKDGGVRQFDALILAAGTRCILRQSLVVEQKHRPYPWGAFWAVLEHAEWPFADVLMQRYSGARVMCGVLPTGQHPESGRTCYSLFWSVPRKNFDHFRRQGPASLVQAIKPVWPEVAEWLAGTPDVPVAMAEYSDVRMKQWHDGRIVVIGDAAHAMSPQLGQGANLALIDAWVLTKSLRENDDVRAAFAKYSNRRRAHLRYYQFASNIMTPLYQSNWPVGWLRDIGTVLGRHMPPVYRQYLSTLCGGKTGLLSSESGLELC